jgi:hypothetical protein
MNKFTIARNTLDQPYALLRVHYCSAKNPQVTEPFAARSPVLRCP